MNTRRGRMWATGLLGASLAAACDPGATTADAGRTPADAAVKTDLAAPGVDASGSTADGTVKPDQGVPADAGPGTDAAGGDAALGDAGALPPDPGQAAPPLFGPDVPGATPLDAPIAAVIDAWQSLPTDEPTAQKYVADLKGALATLRENGEAAADRIADVCAAVPPQATGATMNCLRLLSIVESPRSLDLLTERARTVVPPWPEGAHPHDPPPEALARQVAFRSLGQRVRAGSSLATDLLFRLASDQDARTRGEATAIALEALPRSRAKARLRQILPPTEHYRLYQTR